MVDEDQVYPGNLVPARLDLPSGGSRSRDSHGWRNFGLDLVAKKVVVFTSTNINDLLSLDCSGCHLIVSLVFYLLSCI